MPYNQLIAVWRGNTFCTISSLWNLLKLPLHNNTWLVLQINHSKRMCLLQLQCVVLHMYQLGRVPCCCSLLKSCSTLVTPWTAAHQDSLSFTTSWSLLKLMSLSWWCCPTISSSVAPFSSYPQSFPASASFPRSQLFISGGQSMGASASVLPMNIQDWFPSGLTGLLSLLSKGLSRVFSRTTIQKHKFFGAWPSIWSNFHIHTWLLERP